MAYKLAWEDRFDQNGKPDSAIWNIVTGGTGFGNNESQYYTDRDKNVFVKDGTLNIVAFKEPFDNRLYTSAKLTTFGKKSIGYGRVEVVAKLPQGAGTWPAIWFLGNNIKDAGWPKCGEIDLMEHVGKNPKHIHFSMHCSAFNFHKNNQRTHVEVQENVLDGFHEYALEWDENSASFFLDQKKCASFFKNPGDTSQEWPFNQEMYLILNLAIGGNWGGPIDDSIFPVSIQFRSVKVFERG
jgi:beta-glucanase (GH16 family)